MEARIAEQDALKAQGEANRQAQIAENLQLNTEARAAYLAKLDREKAARQAEDLARVEAELAPVKQHRQRAWLIDHPGHGPADFERVWPLIREEIAEEQRRTQAERDMVAARTRFRL